MRKKQIQTNFCLVSKNTFIKLDVCQALLPALGTNSGNPLTTKRGAFYYHYPLSADEGVEIQPRLRGHTTRSGRSSEVMSDDGEQKPWFQRPWRLPTQGFMCPWMHSSQGGSLFGWYHLNVGRSSFHLRECLCLTSGKNKCPRKEKEEVLLESESWNRFLWSTRLSSFPRLLTLGQSKLAEWAWGGPSAFLGSFAPSRKHLSRRKLLFF